MAQNAPFVVQPQLTAIALMYSNPAFIADRMLPRIPVISPAFKWSKFTMADGFTIPDTRVGRKGRVGEIDWTATEMNDSTLDYGLDDTIPAYDILAAQASAQITGVKPIDPEKRSTQLLTSLVALDRENRVATTLQTLGTYSSSQRTTLSGTSQWSDFTNSDPVQAILAALDSCLVRPNKMEIGQLAWSKLRTHPKVTAFVMPNGGNASVGGAGVTQEAFAAAFELDEVIVGQTFANSAKPGQTPSLTRLWGKHCILFFQPPGLENTEGVMTFGFTAQWGEKIAGVIANDMNVGLRGGDRVRVGESVKEVVAANDAAYFFQNCVA